MTDIERLMHIRKVAFVLAVEAACAALEAGLVSWEDYPDLPEGVWAELVEHMYNAAPQMRSKIEGFEASYAALSALAEEVGA